MIRRLSQEYKLANERLDFVLGFIIWDFKSKTKASRYGPYREVALVAGQREEQKGDLEPATSREQRCFQ